jgi:hypothetical protein
MHTFSKALNVHYWPLVLRRAKIDPKRTNTVVEKVCVPLNPPGCSSGGIGGGSEWVGRMYLLGGISVSFPLGHQL